MSQSASSLAAARAALGLSPQDGPEAAEAAFRRRVGPLSRAAATDPEASERLRELIASRARLRAAARERAVAVPEPASASAPEAAPVRPAPPEPDAIRPRAFRLLDGGPHVQVDVSLDAVVALAENGATAARLLAPILRRCPTCLRGGRAACGHCHGAGVVATGRVRAAPLDLTRIAEGDMGVDAAPWSDAVGRAAQDGPRLFLRLV